MSIKTKTDGESSTRSRCFCEDGQARGEEDFFFFIKPGSRFHCIITVTVPEAEASFLGKGLLLCADALNGKILEDEINSDTVILTQDGSRISCHSLFLACKGSLN